MTTTRERTRLLRRPAEPSEITTPPAGTVLPPYARTGAPDIPVTSVTPVLPPGWEPAGRAPAPAPADAGEPVPGTPAGDTGADARP
ncbi:two-component sensor histidine kinase, partial [Streptomyces pilosus]